MNRYFAYWKRGWWAALMMTLVNLVVSVLVAFTGIGLGAEPSVAWPIAVAVWLIMGAPFAGWLFEVFASHSRRIPGQSGSRNG